MVDDHEELDEDDEDMDIHKNEVTFASIRILESRLMLRVRKKLLLCVTGVTSNAKAFPLVDVKKVASSQPTQSKIHTKTTRSTTRKRGEGRVATPCLCVSSTEAGRFLPAPRSPRREWTSARIHREKTGSAWSEGSGHCLQRCTYSKVYIKTWVSAWVSSLTSSS